MSDVKWVKRLEDGEVFDVPAGHWALSSDDYKEVDNPSKKTANPPAKKPAAKSSKAKS